MTNVIIKTTNETKRDRRTTAERQAAKSLGVVLSGKVTTPYEFYGQKMSYTQIFATLCGNKIVVRADEEKFSAALFERAFEWDEDFCNGETNYSNMNAAAYI